MCCRFIHKKTLCGVPTTCKIRNLTVRYMYMYLYIYIHIYIMYTCICVFIIVSSSHNAVVIRMPHCILCVLLLHVYSVVHKFVLVSRCWSNPLSLCFAALLCYLLQPSVIEDTPLKLIELYVQWHLSLVCCVSQTVQSINMYMHLSSVCTCVCVCVCVCVYVFITVGVCLCFFFAV